MLINLSADGQILRFLADDDNFIETLIAKITVSQSPALQELTSNEIITEDYL